MPSRPAVAIFDVDGTLLRSPSWPLFIKAVKQAHPRLVPAYTLAKLWFKALTLLRRESRQAATLIGLRWLVSRLSAEQLGDVTEQFLDDVLDTQLRPGAIDHLIQRRKAGDRIIFATAGFDFYVGPMAARLGGADVIATRTLSTPTGRILPKLDGSICRGADKLARVKALFSGTRRPPFIRAFASRESDFGLLAWADAGTAVNPEPSLADQAQALGLAVVDWSFGANDAPVRMPSLPVLGTQRASEPSKQR